MTDEDHIPTDSPEHCLTEKQKRTFKRICKSMDRLIEDVRKTHPHANYYVDGTENVNLMSNVPHPLQEYPSSPRYDRVLASHTVLTIDGGDW